MEIKIIILNRIITQKEGIFSFNNRLKSPIVYYVLFR